MRLDLEEDNPMSEDETENLVWSKLTEPAQMPFINRMNELTGLVHYTSFPGLRGIIENEELWFSPVAGMNDFQEVSRGKQMLEVLSNKGQPLHEVITELLNEGERSGLAFEQAYETSKGGDLFDTFVSCWSTCDLNKSEHDNLSMWRGYASDGNGAAILINPTDLGLVQLFESHIVAYPVFYETEDAFIERARGSLAHFLENLQALDQDALKEHAHHAVDAFTDLCF